MLPHSEAHTTRFPTFPDVSSIVLDPCPVPSLGQSPDSIPITALSIRVHTRSRVGIPAGEQPGERPEGTAGRRGPARPWAAPHRGASAAPGGKWAFFLTGRAVKSAGGDGRTSVSARASPDHVDPPADHRASADGEWTAPR